MGIVERYLFFRICKEMVYKYSWSCALDFKSPTYQPFTPTNDFEHLTFLASYITIRRKLPSATTHVGSIGK